MITTIDIELPPGTKYGLLDTVDSCWLGDDEGPKLFDDFWIARLVAQRSDVQLGNQPGRTRAVPFHGKQLYLKDTVATKMDTLSAQQRLEDGLD